MPPKPAPEPPIDKLTLDQARLSLATLNERLASSENLRASAAKQVTDLTAQITQLQAANSTAAADLAAAKADRDALAQQLQGSAASLATAQSTVLAQQEELGRLRPAADELQQVKADRDVIREELASVRASIPQVVQDQVQKQLADLTQAQNAELASLTSQRDQLAARVKELEAAANASTGSQEGISPANLAGHFADVLAELGNRPAVGDAAFSAAVTGMSVEAMGMLRATKDGNVELITEPSAAVPAEQLTKVSFELKLLPRLGNASGSS